MASPRRRSSQATNVTHWTRGAIWATSARIVDRIVDRYSRRNYDLGFDADPGFDTDQTPAYDLTEPEPLPDFNFDQRHGA